MFRCSMSDRNLICVYQLPDKSGALRLCASSLNWWSDVRNLDRFLIILENWNGRHTCFWQHSTPNLPQKETHLQGICNCHILCLRRRKRFLHPRKACPATTHHKTSYNRPPVCHVPCVVGIHKRLHVRTAHSADMSMETPIQFVSRTAVRTLKHVRTFQCIVLGETHLPCYCSHCAGDVRPCLCGQLHQRPYQLTWRKSSHTSSSSKFVCLTQTGIWTFLPRFTPCYAANSSAYVRWEILIFSNPLSESPPSKYVKHHRNSPRFFSGPIPFRPLPNWLRILFMHPSAILPSACTAIIMTTHPSFINRKTNASANHCIKNKISKSARQVRMPLPWCLR